MEPYTYSTLDLGVRAIRLIRLFGGIGQLRGQIYYDVLGPGVTSYEAVSYTWGPETCSIVYIEILGHDNTITRLSIQRNLYHLLEDLRHPDCDRVLWVDAICINQNPPDETERNHQVQQMADVYQCAESVAVWLGRSTLAMNVAMTTLRRKTKSFTIERIRKMAACNEYARKGSQDHEDPLFDGMKTIFNQPWFYRIWVLQEVGNARTASIYCGKINVSSAVFALAPSLFGIEVDSHCQAVLDLMPRSPVRLGTGSIDRDLFSLLQEFREAQASKEHDYIYALLGLCSKARRSLIVDYNQSISTVITEVINYISPYNVSGASLYFSVSDFQLDFGNLDEEVLRILASSGETDILRSIFKEPGVNVKVTYRILESAALNPENGRELFDLIMEQVARTVATQDKMTAAVNDWDPEPTHGYDLE
ncbi:hypothetical protein O1611_g8825 [Lasiodiplodia mahajangana]|uniref:Uncharacterized protein n=1 Tax=Lasiodiplodia mahajangana TaxID=1108764 RepID=A0ACC2JBK1_9PEZI|nr:hypothetical protein O1611_g8825 [Lasiodiplodia mahajangana]